MTGNNMPTKLPTICVAFHDDLLEKIKHYQKKTGIISRAEVVRQLVRIALETKEENQDQIDEKK
ncbi:MAG: hypothetical protein JXQ30_02580 [Spirochaetes bacterium]|nr:hypothetical protein [Spirochaetota bacterium]